jgi:uncharacterized protein (TIGR04255 family)
VRIPQTGHPHGSITCHATVQQLFNRKGGSRVPLDVSDVDRSLLARSPITNAICQVRFDATPRAGGAQVIQALRERLGGETTYPELEQISEGAINIAVGAGAGRMPQPVSASGWRIAAADGSKAIALLPTSVAFESFTYEGWEESFAPQLDDLLDAIASIVQPVFEQRLGLRYINQLTFPEVQSPGGWRGHVEDLFLGIGSDDELGPLSVYSRQQFVLEPEEGVRLTVNHGYAPDDARDDALTYVLDLDVAREGMRPFDPRAIRTTADAFNTYALRVFQRATTPQLRDVLKSG